MNDPASNIVNISWGLGVIHLLNMTWENCAYISAKNPKNARARN